MKITAEQLVELKTALTDPNQFLVGPKMPAWYDALSFDEKADVMLELSKYPPPVVLQQL